VHGSSRAIMARGTALTAVFAFAALNVLSLQLAFTAPPSTSLRGVSSGFYGAASRAASESHSPLGLKSLGVALAGAIVFFNRRSGRSRTRMHAVSEIGQIKLNLIGGKATPAPPVGPAIGSYGLNIAMFVKEYNALTSDKVGQGCPCIVHVMSDKSFSIELRTPQTAKLLHKAAGVEKGAGLVGQEICGTITIEQLEEIARIKLPDLNIEDVGRAMKQVHGTARATGIKVEGYEEWLKTAVPKPKFILDRYGSKMKTLPAPWGEGPPLPARYGVKLDADGKVISVGEVDDELDEEEAA